MTAIRDMGKVTIIKVLMVMLGVLAEAIQYRLRPCRLLVM